MDIPPRLFEKLLYICPEGIVCNDREGNILLFNASAERVFGYTRDEVVGKVNVSSLYPTGGAREVKVCLYSEDYGGRGRLIDYETEALHKDGRKIPIRLSCAVLHEGEKEIGVIGFFTDITARKALEQEYRESEERFRGIVESASDAIISVDEDRNIVMLNTAAEAMLGYTKDEMVGMNFRRLMPPKYGDNWEQIERYAASGDPLVLRKYVELSALGKTGKEFPIQMSMAEKKIRGKKVVTAIIRDISARKAMEEELRLLSITDTLTQLYNRRHFSSLAQKELERAARTKVPFSIIMIDVDRFKKYNDTYGHNEGDKVLKTLGKVVRKNFRTMDSSFRFGGEEFVILLPETCVAGAMVAAERFRILFSEEEFRPLPGNPPVTMTVSIGMVEYYEGYTIDDMIRFSDLAMYAAKNGGRNRSVSYESLINRPVSYTGPGS
ncbi:MAG: diguanylate cyclase [Deltaproteobacteria bacterium]|nr:diguanylate cyclase [Deltaproteobacteria bacterium]